LSQQGVESPDVLLRSSESSHAGFSIHIDRLMRSIESFCAAGGAACATLALMLVAITRTDHHAKISLAVFLRLTKMDVCCGPPAAL
jgi:hypothetical protein